MRIELAEDEFATLVAAELGLVRRLPRRPGLSPEDGQDWRLHGRIPARDRRCTVHVRRLLDLALVVLPAGEPDAPWWTYQTTHLGKFVMAQVYRREVEP